MNFIEKYYVFKIVCTYGHEVSLICQKDLIYSDGFCFPRVQFELWDSDDVPVPRQELLKKVKGVDGLLCVLTEKIDRELLDAAGMRTVLEPVK